MSLETADFISQLIQSNPEGTDPKSRGDDHLRLIKHVLQTQFPNFLTPTPVQWSPEQMNAIATSGVGGMGASAIPFTDANAAAGGFQSGVYYLNATPGANTPPGAVAGDTMLQIVTNSTLITQTWFGVASLQVWVRGWSGGAWSGWLPYTKGPKQITATDLTAGAVMAVAAFGMGGRGETQPATNLDAVLPCTQFIGIQPGMAGTLPPGANPGDMCLSICFNGAHVYQVYWTFSNALMWTRQYNSGWTGWQCLNPIGTFQTWQNPARALNTTYTNTTARAIEVVVAGTTAGASGSVTLAVTGATIATASWGAVSSGNLPWSVGGIIPPGMQYSCTLSGGSMNSWAELRL